MNLLYSEKDMLFAKRLLIWGQKFMRVKKQDFIKVVGSAGCKVDTPITDIKEINFIKEENPTYIFHGNIDDAFDKRPRLICEPNNSDCPDFKGTDKHWAKKHGHTPSKEYKVDAIDLCAVGYLDLDRQPRKPFISLRSIELNKGYSKN